MKWKPLITELITLIAILALILLVLLTAEFIIFRNTHAVTIQMYTSYFIFLPWQVFAPPFTVLLATVYLFKEAFYGYKRKLQNFVILISLFLFIMLLQTFYEIAAQMALIPSGVTIYPPLSAIPQSVQNHPGLLPFRNILLILFFIQIIFMILLVIVAILTGKNWNYQKNEQQVP
jgi:hypothetical protein